jgi:hypothetical protein
MKQYPSIWITEQLEPDTNGMPRKVFDISVKLTADSKPVHYNKYSEKDAIEFCNNRFGGYNSIKKAY